MDVVNFAIHDLELKMTDDRGRGLFAKRKLEKGELLIAEKAIAVGTEDVIGSINKGDSASLIQKCIDLAQVKGIHALRLS